MENGREAIDDEELLYRRVPASTGWYDQETGILMSQAFGPNKKWDFTGISVVRGKYKTIDEAAQGQPGKSYFIAVLCAGDLRKRDIEVVPRPDLPEADYDPAHAELPDLRADNRKSDRTLEIQRILAEELTQRVEGPFETPGGDLP